MERLILGERVKGKSEAGGSEAFCEFHMYVERGHGECGDSAFVYSDGERLIAGVFDGVSGEAGASSASSTAASAVLDFLKRYRRVDEDLLRDALAYANTQIRYGLTTAAIMFMGKDGGVVVAEVGDSPVYGVGKGEACLELPLARPVGEEDSVMKFLYFRNLVTSVLGPSETDIHACLRSGKLEKGEMLILASDGLSDNLYLKVKDGFVKDASGNEDLGNLLKGKRKPKTIVAHLAREIKKRIKAGRKEKPGVLLVPKPDDIALIVVRRL